MTTPFGRADFFALEAGEYLDQLTGTVAGTTPPPVEEFVRLTRALRGAAMMGGPAPLAKAAAALEQVAKTYRDGSVTWSSPVAETVTEAVREFQVLVPRATQWSEGDAERAANMAAALDRVGKAGAGRSAPPTSQATVLTFVAREASRIAGALETIGTGGRHPQPEALRTVLARMQSIRGLAPEEGLTSVGVLLDGLETALGELLRGYPPPQETGEVLRAACDALVSYGDRDSPDQQRRDEVERFTRLLYDHFAREVDVVPIATLLAPGATPERAAPTRPDPDPMALVSLGDRLRQAAAQLGQDTATASRRVHLYSLIASLRALAHVSDSPALRPLTEALRGSVSGGEALRNTERLIKALQAAAQPLGEASRISPGDLGADLAHAAEMLRPISPPPQPPTVPADEERDVVPIATLLLTEDQPGDRTTFERSFSTLHRLRRSPRGEVPLAAGIAESAAVEAIVSIDTLLYRGVAARRRADDVRREITLAMANAPTGTTLQPLIDELLDLVPLALDHAD